MQLFAQQPLKTQLQHYYSYSVPLTECDVHLFPVDDIYVSMYYTSLRRKTMETHWRM